MSQAADEGGKSGGIKTWSHKKAAQWNIHEPDMLIYKLGGLLFKYCDLWAYSGQAWPAMNTLMLFSHSGFLKVFLLETAQKQSGSK